jgi:hypothetical protein
MVRIGEESYLSAVEVGYPFRKFGVITRHTAFHRQTFIQNQTTKVYSDCVIFGRESLYVGCGTGTTSPYMHSKLVHFTGDSTKTLRLQ